MPYVAFLKSPCIKMWYFFTDAALIASRRVIFVSYALEALFRSNPTVFPEPFAQFARDAYT